MKSLGRDALVERLRGDAFGLSARAVRPLRVGLEAEMIAVDGTSGEPAPLVAPGAVGVLSLLDALLERGWEKDESRFGVPRYRHPGGGAFSLEPGAQIEYSSPAFPSVTALLADVERALDPLTQEAAARGLRLLTRGVDPLTRGARASLQLSTDRYRRMASHFARLGPWGHCMMCQTASVHVNLDYGESPLLRWRVANALAPVLTATFANSPRYAGQDTGLRSWRAEQWRRLDPLRTGLFASSGDPAVDDLFQIGLEQMNQRNAPAAIATFSEIIKKKPEFAEGWNKRATLYYLIGEYDKSLADCEEVIRRNPVHFGALSGFGMIYLQQGKPEKALDYFQRALQVNPNLGQVEAAVEQLKRTLIQRKRDTI